MKEIRRTCTKCDKSLSLSNYYSQKNGKSGKRAECIKCHNIRSSHYRNSHKEEIKAYNSARKEEIKAYSIAYRSTHKEEIKTLTLKYNIAHKEEIKTYRLKHKEKIKAYNSAYYSKSPKAQKIRTTLWAKKNPEKIVAYAALTRAKRKKAYVSWADKEEITTFYKLAQQLTRDTGIQHVVDHFYPLKGKLSSGLHVPCNLQVITCKENSEKSNLAPEEYYKNQDTE